MTASTERVMISDLTGVDAVRQFMSVPAWLAAALDPDTVKTALNKHVPEFAAGTLTLRDCEMDKLHLKSVTGQWERTWELIVDGPSGEMHVPVRVNVTAPGLPTPELPTETLPFATDGWSCWLPELRMLVRPLKAKRRKELPTLADLVDGERARPLLEATLREQTAGYEDVTIRSVAPEILVHKPGDSTIIRYRLDYGPEGADRGWRDIMILKAYRDDIGRNAYAGMTAVWQAGLKDSSVVAIPEPLAYLASHFATLQGPVSEEFNIEKWMLKRITSDDPADLQAMHTAFRDAGVALAAFHTCGATPPQVVSWEESFTEPQKQINWLQVPFPDAMASFGELIGRLRALEAALPVDPLVSSHGAFRPEQVLSYQGAISFIDFDCVCMSEPANDLALYRATVLDSGLFDDGLPPMDEAESTLRLQRLDALNESFLAAYEAHTPVSRQRVALWEASLLINDVLQRWAKPHHGDAFLGVPVLERHLRGLGVL